MVVGHAVSKLKRGIADAVRRGDDGQRTELAVSPNRRRFLQKAGASAAVAGAGLSATSGSASAYTLVGPDLIKCDNLSRTQDTELPFDSGGNYGGWRATEHFGVSGGGVDKVPVVFVHGNGGDACNFEEHAQYLLNNGWNGDEIYSITFEKESSYHTSMRDQLDDFVQNVMNETGVNEVSLVAHSLGVTGVRFWADDLDRYSWVNAFVFLNGGNHGVCVCPGCYDTTLDGDFNKWLSKGKACQFIAVQCFSDPDHPLYELNLPDETPNDSDIGYHTVRGFFDPLFTCNPWSPYLDGADNNLIYRNHTGSLKDDGTKADVDEWVTATTGDETDSTAKGSAYWTPDLDSNDNPVAKITIPEDTISNTSYSDDMYARIYDPSDNIHDEVYFDSSNDDDGDYTFTLDMPETNGSATEGSYDVEIWKYTGSWNKWWSDTQKFSDYDINLTNTDYWVAQDSDGDWYLTEWEHTVQLGSDLPIPVSQYELTVDGSATEVYPDRVLKPKDNDVYHWGESSSTSEYLGSCGTYDVSIDMYADGNLFAKGTDSFTISC